MRPGFLLRVALPIALGVLLAFWFVADDHEPEAQVTPSCAGFVLASGIVTSSGDHELRGTPASVEVGGYTLIVPSPDLPTWQRVVEAHQQAYELVLRPVASRELLRVTR
jgi:hypothetical protein